MDRDLQVRFSPDIFRTQTYGGVSRYITELHRGLIARGIDSRILAWLHINAYLHELPRHGGSRHRKGAAHPRPAGPDQGN